MQCFPLSAATAVLTAGAGAEQRFGGAASGAGLRLVIDTMDPVENVATFLRRRLERAGFV